MMRAVRCVRLDGPDGLELGEAPVPHDPRDVIIDVRAAGVGFPDLLMTRGGYQIHPEPPFTPGVEVAGIVRSAPPDSPFRPGDRVTASSKLGAWSEVAAATPAMTWSIPDGMSFEQATSMVNYQTAYFAFMRRTTLRPGETVLIQGAAGGTGTAAIEVAKGLGAKVIAIAQGEAKRTICAGLGADEVLEADSAWLDDVKKITDGRGVDIVYDPVGGERFLDSVRALARDGRLLVIGFAGGAIPEIKVNRLLLKNTSLVGAAWGEYVRHDPTMAQEIAVELAKLWQAGAIKPLVGSRYPLERAADALREIEGRRATGKVVLVLGA